MMDETRIFLQGMNLPGRDLHFLPDSPTCFIDGARYRVEIPGVENPAALEAVIETSREVDLTIHRVTALNGIMLLADRELREMADLGAAQRMEVCLAVGPRAAYDPLAGAGRSAAKAANWRLSGIEELVHAIEDVRHAVAMGIRSVLVADEGLLWVLREMKSSALLPPDLALRAAATLGASNPASLWLLEELGASSFALPNGLPLPRIAAMRSAVDMPLEVVIEDDDLLGSFSRLYEVPDIVRITSPVYLSYHTGRIAAAESLSGDAGIALCRARVRHARLGQNMLERYFPQATSSLRGAEGIAMPVYIAS